MEMPACNGRIDTVIRPGDLRMLQRTPLAARCATSAEKRRRLFPPAMFLPQITAARLLDPEKLAHFTQRLLFKLACRLES